MKKSRFIVLASLVAALAAVNAFARLGSEFVTEWDESLYAMSAAEMLDSGDWIGTTRHGELDYFNSKPPLNAWMIALSMKAFGRNITAMRLPSATAAFLSVVLMMVWARRAFDEATALLSGIVLATSFAFFYVHSGRTANADAWLALFVFAIPVVIWRAIAQPPAFVLVGVLVAGAFMLKGAAVVFVISVALVSSALLLRQRLMLGWVGLAALSAAVPIAWYVVARWQIDGAAFFRILLGRDAMERSLSAIEGHEGSLLYYVDVLQRYQYAWIAGGGEHAPCVAVANNFVAPTRYLAPVDDADHYVLCGLVRHSHTRPNEDHVVREPNASFRRDHLVARHRSCVSHDDRTTKNVHSRNVHLGGRGCRIPFCVALVA